MEKHVEKFTVYLTSLPPTSSENQIKQYFSTFAKVRSCRLIYSKGLCKGFGMLEIEDIDGFRRILQKEHFILGRRITVEEYLEGNRLEVKRNNINERRVRLSNIHYTISDAQLKEAFTVFGPVVNAYRIVKSDGKKMKFGFLLFEDEANANKCCRRGNLFIKGKDVKTEKFVPKENENHQKKSLHSNTKKKRLKNPSKKAQSPSVLPLYILQQELRSHDLDVEPQPPEKHWQSRISPTPMYPTALILALSDDIDKNHYIGNLRIIKR